MNGGKTCRKEGITYEIQCEECGDKYVGESARNGYTRGREMICKSTRIKAKIL